MATVGTGTHRYDLVENWAKLPSGQTFGNVSAVATDSRDRVYVFQRKDPPMLVFERDGTYVTGWGIGAFANPHGIFIANDVAYLTDRDDSVCLGIEEPKNTPRATDQENLRAMSEMVLALERNGHTYRRDGSIYFKITSLPTYGQLARLE